MQYRQLGKAGIKVSALSFGSWLTFGGKIGEQQARECMNYAFDQGINFFDNAEVYSNGNAEILMGKALKDFRREDVVVSTKIFWGGKGPNDTGLSRKHLIEGTKNSLKRLQLDYVDLLFCHRPDPSTPIAETVLAMDYLVRSGQAFYWGTSEWSAAQIQSAFETAAELNCIPPSMEQSQYNLFHRHRIEQEYAPLYEQYQLGITSFSPLASGILSGKYNNGIPENSRLALEPHWGGAEMGLRINKAKNLDKMAQELNCTTAQLSLAWCLKNPHVSSVIIGASRLEQLKENLKAMEVVELIDAQTLKKIEALTI